MCKPKTSIPTDDWNIIVKKIHVQKCVPFLGAGVNIKCGKEGSLPLGADVALRLLQRMINRTEEISDASYRINWKNLTKYREDARAALVTFSALTAAGIPLDETAIEKLLQSVLQILPDEQGKLAHIIFDESLDQYQDLTRVALQDLARVSLRYRRNKNLSDFVAELKEIIRDTEQNAPRLLRVLADMPFELIVTTNYDRLMERALELFTESALTQADELTKTVKAKGTPLSQFIFDSVSDDMYLVLEEYGKDEPKCELRSLSVWIDELNALIQERSLHLLGNKDLMKDGLTDEVWTELDKRPEKIDTVILNRIFLESSYPDLLKPHIKPHKEIIQPLKVVEDSSKTEVQKRLAEDEKLIVYKLHGTFGDDDADENNRPVITEEDYIEFLTYVGGKGDNIDNIITSKIQTSTLLFLGYSLEDWNFRALFKGLIEKLNPSVRPFSYAIQKDPSEFWVRFWEGNNRKVHIFNMDMCEFTGELESRYRAYAKQIQQVGTAASELKARRDGRRQRSGRQ